MAESLRTRLWRWGFNCFPAYRGTGGRVTYIAADWREVRIKLPLNWRTRNYVGTTFGGSLYGAVDPFYMIMLIKLLGPDYIVRDKAAAILFRKPGPGHGLRALPDYRRGASRHSCRTRNAAVGGPQLSGGTR